MSALGIIGTVLPVISDVVDRLLPNSAEREKVKLELQNQITQAITSIDVAQLNVNAEEAKHPNIFVAGWRPFCGWVGGIGLAYHAIVQPLILFIAALEGIEVTVPAFDNEILTTVLFGMLGLGTMRSFEKLNAVDTKVTLPWLKKK